MSPRDFVRLVLNNIEFETESTTRLTLLRQLTTAVRSFVAPKNRDGVLIDAADQLWSLAKRAEAGSDAQFQFVRFFAQFAVTDAHFDSLARLLDGSDKLAGLEIDADLRWELIGGLVVGGRIDEAGIAAALANDNTANGQKAAAAARASLPTAAAKAAIWHTLVETHELSNTLLDAASLSFGRTLDDSLLEPYVDKYFDRALHMWNSNTFKIAEYLLENLYPIGLASESLQSKTKAFIAHPEVAEIPALKRILIENLANVDRALRAQAADLKG
jgi:aminopeptidase N